MWRTAETLGQRALAISGSVGCNYLDEWVVSQVMGLVVRPQLFQLTHPGRGGVQNSICWAPGIPAADACSMAASIRRRCGAAESDTQLDFPGYFLQFS